MISASISGTKLANAASINIFSGFQVPQTSPRLGDIELGLTPFQANLVIKGSSVLFDAIKSKPPGNSKTNEIL